MSFIASRIFATLSLFFFATPAFVTTAERPTEISLKARSVSESLRKMKNLEEKSKKTVILLGDTGVGKSTLASLLTYSALQAKYCEDTGKVVIECIEEHPEFSIKRQEESDDDILSLPVKAQTASGFTIWDFPGFSNKEDQSTIMAYSLSRIFANSEKTKVVIVITEDAVKNRGAVWLDTIGKLENLLESKDIEESLPNLTLVVTHVTKKRTVDQVGAELKKWKSKLGEISNEAPASKVRIFDALVSNIILFYRAEEENEKISNDIVSIILGKGFSDPAFKVLPPKDQTICGELCGKNAEGIMNISHTLCTALNNPWLCEQGGKDPFSISSLELPRVAKESNSAFPEEDSFSRINQIKEIIGVLESTPKYRDLTAAVSLIKALLSNLENYVVNDGENEALAIGLRYKLRQFAEAIQQQTIYAQTFADFTGRQEELAEIGKQIIQALLETKQNLEQELLRQINNFEPDPREEDPEYFQAAISLLEGAAKTPLTHKWLGKCHQRLGKCHQSIGKFYAEDEEYAKAGLAYIEALKLDPKSCLNDLGAILVKLELYASAMKLYSTNFNTLALEKCSKKLLKTEQSPTTHAQVAQAMSDVGLGEKAKEHYMHAASLTENEAEKNQYWRNAINVSMNSSLPEKLRRGNVLSENDLEDFYKLIQTISTK